MIEEEERRNNLMSKKQQACKIFLHIHWSFDSTTIALIRQFEPTINNFDFSPPFLLSWQ
jgi:hypothetical protein